MPCDSRRTITVPGTPARRTSADALRTAFLAGTVVLGATLMLPVGGPAAARDGSTPPGPSAPQPTLPKASAAESKPDPSIVQTIVSPTSPSTLEVRKAPARRVAIRRGHNRRGHLTRGQLARGRGEPLDVDRPALAGVQLLRPLPPPEQPPHFVVPTPAYPFENFVTAYTTPPAPLFCHPTRRDPDLPDPHLYRERTVVCEPDNP